MSEMTPDPVLDKLGRFTPSAEAVDSAGLLFAAGRASARTSWGWKVAVAGLLILNSISLGFLISNSWNSKSNPPALEQNVTTPVPAEPVGPPPGTSSESPWTYRSLMSLGDPDKFPASSVLTNPSRTNSSLSVLSARDGVLD